MELNFFLFLPFRGANKVNAGSCLVKLCGKVYFLHVLLLFYDGGEEFLQANQSCAARVNRYRTREV